MPFLERVMRWGKGPKQQLRFTKTGEPKLEEISATHLVWPGKMPFHERAAGEGASVAQQPPVGGAPTTSAGG